MKLLLILACLILLVTITAFASVCIAIGRAGQYDLDGGGWE